MDGMKMNVSDIAKHLGMSRVNISRIVNGKAGISADMALRLSEAFDTSSDHWLRMQIQHDLWKASRKRRAKVAQLTKTRTAA